MRDEMRRMALFGSGVAELTRHRAEQMAKELVERSRQNRSEILKLVRNEIQNQIAALGLATKRDFERLERRVTRLETGSKAGTGTKKKGTTGKKTTATRKATSTRARKKSPGGSSGSPPGGP